MTTTMLRRPRRRAPAIIVGIVLLAVCVAVVWSAVRSLLDRGAGLAVTQLRSRATGTGWDETVILVAAAVLAAVGLVLAICGLWPGRPTVLPLATGEGLAAAGITRTGLTRSLTRAAIEVDGAYQAKTTVRRRQAAVTVWCGRIDTAGLEAKVGDRLQRQLDHIDLAKRPRLRLRIRPGRED